MIVNRGAATGDMKAATAPLAWLEGVALRPLAEFLTGGGAHAAGKVGKRASAICAVIIGLSLAVKLWLVLTGAIMETRTDGASRLFVAMDRFGDPTYFSDPSTWTSLPLPIPQLFYTGLYALDVASGGALPVDTTTLSVNAAIFAVALGLFAATAGILAGGRGAVAFSVLGTAAYMPNYMSVTAAVEPPALFFFAAALYLVHHAGLRGSRFGAALTAAGFLAASTAFRLEFVVLTPLLAVLVYRRFGFMRALGFVALAASYVALQTGAQWLSGDSLNYANMREYYASLRPLDAATFLASPFYRYGIADTWGAPLLPVAMALVVAGLFYRSSRLASVLALTSLGFIIFLALSGRIAAGQPRYAILAMLLAGLPISVVAGDASRWASRRLGSVALPIMVGSAAIFVIWRGYATLERRQADPPGVVRQIADALFPLIGIGESTFFDYANSYDFPLAIRAASISRAPSYVYVSRCCVADAANEALGADRVGRLTSQRSVVLPGLELRDRLTAAQIWAHGFVERHRPRYFVLLDPARSREFAAQSRWPEDMASTIWPFATPLAEGRGAPLRLDLPYAGIRVELTAILANSYMTLYEAEYPR